MKRSLEKYLLLKYYENISKKILSIKVHFRTSKINKINNREILSPI